MDRRRFIGLLGTGVAASSTKSVFALSQTHSNQAAERPNFLFIICDDLTYRTIHRLNNPEVHTPNMDRLAHSGCAFTHCFHQGSWSGAVCVPSRTMLTSGLTAFHAEDGLDKVPTWGQTLGVAGYDTYICGKWHLDPTVLQRSFKEMGPVAPGMLDSTPEGGAAYDRPRPGDDWQPWDESLNGHWLHTQLCGERRLPTRSSTRTLSTAIASSIICSIARPNATRRSSCISASIRRTIRASRQSISRPLSAREDRNSSQFSSRTSVRPRRRSKFATKYSRLFRAPGKQCSSIVANITR